MNASLTQQAQQQQSQLPQGPMAQQQQPYPQVHSTDADPCVDGVPAAPIHSPPTVPQLSGAGQTPQAAATPQCVWEGVVR